MVLCHIGAMAIEKSKATTECTETATARITTAIDFMASSRACHWRSLPCQPRDKMR